MWDLPGSGIELMSPALAGRFFSMEPPGKALIVFIFLYWSVWAVCIILEIKHLSVTLFGNIFSHSIGCVFVLFTVSFAVQNLASLIRSCLFIFISSALGDWPKKISLWFMIENVLPMFSSRSFMVSCLIFIDKSLSHVGVSLVAQLVKNPPAMQETPVWFLGREDPLQKG